VARSRRPDVETGSFFFLRKLLSGGGYGPAAKASLTATTSDLRGWRIGSGERIDRTTLDQHVSLEDYSVSNRGLRSGLVGTPGQIAERIAEFESVGVDLLLLQCSPQFEEMERFAANIIPTIDP